MLETRLDRDRVEFEAERRATRRATGRVREPGGAAHRAPGPAHTMLRPRDEIREEDLPSDRVMEALPDRALRQRQPDDVGEVSEALQGQRLCAVLRSEEHTSELQSPCNLVCRLLLEKKKRT